MVADATKNVSLTDIDPNYPFVAAAYSSAFLIFSLTNYCFQNDRITRFQIEMDECGSYMLLEKIEKKSIIVSKKYFIIFFIYFRYYFILIDIFLFILLKIVLNLISIILENFKIV